MYRKFLPETKSVLPSEQGLKPCDKGSVISRVALTKSVLPSEQGLKQRSIRATAPSMFNQISTSIRTRIETI